MFDGKATVWYTPCFVGLDVMTFPNHGASCSTFAIVKQNFKQGDMHSCCFTIFGPTKQKLCTIQWFLSLKINLKLKNGCMGSIKTLKLSLIGLE